MVSVYHRRSPNEEKAVWFLKNATTTVLATFLGRHTVFSWGTPVALHRDHRCCFSKNCQTNVFLFLTQHRGIEIWSRPILPIQTQYYSYAVAFVNRRTDGTPSDVAVTLRELGLNNPAGYRVEVRMDHVFVENIGFLYISQVINIH